MIKIPKDELNKMKLKDMLTRYKDMLTQDLVYSSIDDLDYDQDYIKDCLEMINNIIDCCNKRNRF